MAMNPNANPIDISDDMTEEKQMAVESKETNPNTAMEMVVKFNEKLYDFASLCRVPK